MVMVILNYPNLKPTLEALQTHCEEFIPKFEELPGLIDKTWGINEDTGQGASVYHFEDRASADAWFNSEFSKNFRKKSDATIEYFDVAAVAFRRPLK